MCDTNKQNEDNCQVAQKRAYNWKIPPGERSKRGPSGGCWIDQLRRFIYTEAKTLEEVQAKLKEFDERRDKLRSKRGQPTISGTFDVPFRKKN